MNETTFENAKKGDSVYHSRDFRRFPKGWCTVIAIRRNLPCPVQVQFSDGSVTEFTYDGRWDYNSDRTLFWGPPEVIAPPRPRRLVKRTIQAYAYKESGEWRVLDGERFYGIETIGCKPRHITSIEIEVEDEE